MASERRGREEWSKKSEGRHRDKEQTTINQVEPILVNSPTSCLKKSKLTAGRIEFFLVAKQFSNYSAPRRLPERKSAARRQIRVVALKAG